MCACEKINASSNQFIWIIQKSFIRINKLRSSNTNRNNISKNKDLKEYYYYSVALSKIRIIISNKCESIHIKYIKDFSIETSKNKRKQSR